MTPPPLFYVQQRSSSSLGEPLSPLDGCVLLGKDAETATCEYATRYHVSDRELQRQEVVNHVIMDEVVPCCSPSGCAFKERIWGVLRSELILVCMHLTVVTLGFVKAFVHTMEEEHDLHLVHAVLETVITCKILIIRAFAAKEKFHEIKEKRLQLEYVSVEGGTRARSTKIWTFAYFSCSLIMCALVIAFFVVCFKYAHLGWTSLPNNGMIILAVFVARMTMLRYELTIARVQRDHMLLCLLEAKTLLSEQLAAMITAQTQDVQSRVEHFLRGMNRTSAFDKPPYISCMEETEPVCTANTVETGL